MAAYTIALFILFFAAFRYIRGLNTPSLNPWLIPGAYALKVAVGFYFLYVYTAIYGNGSLSADAGAFMEESKVLNDVFYTSPVDYLKLLTGIGDQEALIQQYLMETDHWDSGAQAIISDNRNILRVHSVFHFFSGANPAIHVLVMCFFSLIGMKQLYLGLKDKTTLGNTLLFALLIIFPSVLFWTSGILKEPLLILGIGLFVRGVFSQPKNRLLIISLGCLLMLGFKPYVLFCLIPALIFYLLYKNIGKWKLISASVILVFLGFIMAWSFPAQRQKVVHLLSRKQYDFKNVGKGGLHAKSEDCFYFFRPDQIAELTIEGDSVSISKPMTAMIIQHGSIDEPIEVRLTPDGEKWFIYFRNDRSDGYIETTMIDDSFSQLLKNIPQALINSLLRPFPMDPGSWLKYPAMLETLLLYLFLIYAIIKRRTLKSEVYGLIWSIAVFIICLSLIIGWVTPVLGAIVRYRTPAFIGLFIIGLLLIQSKRLKHE